MTSQIDTDQGWSYRGWIRTYLGPSVGWTLWGANVILPVTAAGTVLVQPGNTLVQVSVSGSVTVRLPPTVLPPVPAGALPGLQSPIPITVVDIGGHAATFPITIFPAAGESIAGVSSVQINTAFGAFVFWPSSVIPGWTTTQ